MAFALLMFLFQTGAKTFQIKQFRSYKPYPFSQIGRRLGRSDDEWIVRIIFAPFYKKVDAVRAELSPAHIIYNLERSVIIGRYSVRPVAD